jgi:ankyrin repeat protein
MPVRFQIRPILAAWRGVLICVVIVIPSLVLLSEGRGWFDRLAGVPVGDELLMIGLSSRHTSWAEAALRQGASPNARDASGNTPLMWAAQAGDQEMVRRLLAAGADVSATSERMTPLSAAAMAGQLEVMNILLNAGAEVNQHAVFQLTALHQATAVSDELAMALLLKHAADVDARNCAGETPLIIAMYRDEEATLPCVRRLL